MGKDYSFTVEDLLEALDNHDESLANRIAEGGSSWKAGYIDCLIDARIKLIEFRRVIQKLAEGRWEN